MRHCELQTVNQSTEMENPLWTSAAKPEILAMYVAELLSLYRVTQKGISCFL